MRTINCNSRLKNWFIILGICVCHILPGQNYTKISEGTKRFIDSTYNALLKKYKVVGASIAIVDHGEIVYATGYGFSDKEKKVLATEKTLFRIGSCTKSFTGLSIMQLQDKKLLDINYSIKRYLPELKIPSRFKDNNEIYIKDILCHASGLPCDISNGFFCDTPPDMTWEINELNKQTTISPRLYMHAYSNVGYGLLGELVARVSKTSYSNYVKDNIFKPLQMSSSYIDHDEQLSAGLSKAYLNNKEIKEPMIRDQAAGLIHSNAVDMAHYIAMYLDRGMFNGTRIVSEQGIKEMEANHMDSVLLSSSENWGYGLYTKKAAVKKDKDSMVVNIIGHGGDTYAFHADFGYIPELNVGVVVLTNTDNGAIINNAARLLKLYVKLTASQTMNLKYKESVKAKTMADAREQACTGNEIIGTYNFGDFLVTAKNPKKIKFKQGPATVKLSQKKSSPGAYTLKAVLYNVIPIKLKGMEARFVKLDDVVYFKQIDTGTDEAIYGGIKSTPAAIPDSWKAKFGNYKITKDYYACTNCPYGNAEGMTLSIMEDHGFILVKTKGKTPDTNNRMFLDVLSDNVAVKGGIGRGSGETFRILDNGNIYYSGFEFSRVK